MEQKNELAIIAEQSGLEPSKAELMLNNFTGLFKQAKEWENKAKGINVTDVSQKAEMKQAREARLALKDIRVNAENVRKGLKEQSLREGKAIDGIANVIKALIVPLEEHLEKQEKFAEEAEKAEKERVFGYRCNRIKMFGLDPNFYNLKEMSNESFEQLVKNAEKAVEDKKIADKKVEEDRIAREKARAEEEDRMRIENAKLKAEAEEKEKIRLAEKEKSDKILREAIEAKEKADKILLDKIEAEEKEKKAKDKAEADRVQAEKEKAERLAKASDEEKLSEIRKVFENLDMPKVESQHAKNLLDKVVIKLDEIVKILK